jgi:hypothetical protein
MAIQFFSINGTGGSSGTMIVHTNNGISGDGSVATPVVLGGNALTGDTAIDGAGHTLTIITNNGTNTSELDVGANSVFTGTTDDASSDAADFTTLNSGGVLSADMELSSGANAKRVHMSRGGGGSGIVITDTVDNVGLIGNALFAISDPKQYVQSGNLSVHTASGISGNGTVATPVILGGTPIAANTSIDANNHELLIGDPNFVNPVLQINNSQIRMIAGNNQIAVNPTGLSELVSNDGAGGIGTVTCRPDGIVLNIADSGGNKTSITLDTGFITVNDFAANTGITANGTVYPVNPAVPDQYAQYGNINSSLFNVAAQDTAGQTTTQVIPPAYTPLSDSIIRVNAYAFYVTGTGSVAVTVAYTDRLGTARTATLGSVAVGTPVTSFPATILKVKGGTTVSVTYTVTGTITYDAGATIENLFT